MPKSTALLDRVVCGAKAKQIQQRKQISGIKPCVKHTFNRKVERCFIKDFMQPERTCFMILEEESSATIHEINKMKKYCELPDKRLLT